MRKILTNNFLLVISASTISLIFIVLSTYVAFEQSQRKKSLNQAGFDRTFTIELVRDYSVAGGNGATRYVANAPSVNDGLMTVLSRESAAEVGKIPQIRAVLPVARTVRQLTFSNGFSAQTTIYNVTPAFLHAFSPDTPASLQKGAYTPSCQIAALLPVDPNIRNTAVLGVADEHVRKLPNDMRNAIDWQVAKVAARITDGCIGSQASSSVFRSTLFTTGAENKISVPGLHLIPKFMVFLKVSESGDVDRVYANIQDFLKRAHPSESGTHFQVRSLATLLADQMPVSAVERWAQTLNNGLLAVTVVLLVMIFLTKYRIVCHEITLRLTFGSPPGSAAWNTMRPMINSVLVAVLSGCIFAGITLKALNLLEIDSLRQTLTILVGCVVGVCTAIWTFGYVTSGRDLGKLLKTL